MTRCFLSLGANLGDRAQTLRWAAQRLRQDPDHRDLRCSSIYRSQAVGPGEQPDYLNAVLGFDTRLQPFELLRRLQDLEREAGRERLVRWGARTLDIDILFYGDLHTESADLTLPHPRISERNFVLVPLLELLGGATLRLGSLTLEQYLDQCADNPLDRTDLSWVYEASGKSGVYA